MKYFILAGIMATTLMGNCLTATAHETKQHNLKHNLRPDSHAPIGVMGDHMHKEGQWMVSYRMMRMDMEGNRNGTSNLSPETIATTFANRFFGTPMQPPTLRVVPTDMTTNMHMIGGMYAPTDNLTLMLMGHYIDREMSHITFQGATGTTRLGKFTTKAKGWGDTKASALIRLHEDDTHHLHLNAGISLPTGSIKEEDDVLTPMNMRTILRLPYAMQLGSGTYDLLPGITYKGQKNKWGWGAQYTGTLRLGDNSQDYTLGDKHQISGWGSYLVTPSVSLSGRVSAEKEGKIDGIDSQIVAPVQTADPNNYGGKRVSLSFGVNTVVNSHLFRGHRFSIEGTLPVYQNLNGPQMKRDSTIIFGWSKSF